MPGCITQAETREGVLTRISEAMRGWLAVMESAEADWSTQPLAIEVTELEVPA